MRNLSKKAKTIIAGAAIAGLASAGGAYAYWTNSGTGTGTAGTGTNVGITVNQTSTVADLYPGGPAGTLDGTFTNTNPSPVFVEQVTTSILNPTAPFTWTAQADLTKPACAAGDFTIHQPTLTHAEVITGTAWAGGTIRLDNNAGNQDNCKNVSPPIHYTSN